MKKWWVSCPVWTVQVNTADGIILSTAPVTRRFVGQPLANLVRWARTFGEVEIAELGQEYGETGILHADRADAGRL